MHQAPASRKWSSSSSMREDDTLSAWTSLAVCRQHRLLLVCDGLKNSNNNNNNNNNDDNSALYTVINPLIERAMVLIELYQSCGA